MLEPHCPKRFAEQISQARGVHVSAKQGVHVAYGDGHASSLLRPHAH